MHKILTFSVLLLLTLAACKSDNKNDNSAADKTSATTLAGFWVPIDFCTRAGQMGSVLKGMNSSSKPYSYALGFDAAIPDSVTCYNGSERWRMPVIYRKDTLEIPKAHGDLSIYLVYDPETNKDLTMFDGTSGSTEINRYTLSRAQVMDGYSAFLMALNNSMMSGNFHSAGKGSEEVRFSPDGSIKGMKDFDHYELCTGGDCVLMQDMDVVSMVNSQIKDSKQTFGYRFGVKKDTLFLYNLINEKPEEKGRYVPGTVAQTYVKTKSKK